MISPTGSTTWRKAELAWLGLALVAHGALLLVPVGLWTEQVRVQPRLTVELINMRARPASPVEDPLQIPPTEAPRPAAAAKSLPEQALPDREVELATASGRPEEAESPVTDATPFEPVESLSTAILLHAAGRMRAARAHQDSPRSLGVHVPRELPSNWGRGMSNEDLLARNAGMAVPMAPAEPVIVDRWLDANGSHNMVVTLPNGETVCGRAQAWDPMQPLVEHIMMFRTCGSGGKRTFEMASRPTPRWSTVE